MDNIYIFNGKDIPLLVCMQLRDVARGVAKRLNLPFDKAIKCLLRAHEAGE